MRITGGQARGIPLTLPKGNQVRPATDALRQAGFFQSRSPDPGCAVPRSFCGQRCLWAGGAQPGCERGHLCGEGCPHGGFHPRQYHRSLQKPGPNAGWPAGGHRRCHQGSCWREAPDLVFVDPPYEIIADVAPGIFLRLAEFRTAKPEMLVIFEMPGDQELAIAGWVMAKRLGKGGRQPTAAIFKASPASP